MRFSYANRNSQNIGIITNHFSNYLCTMLHTELQKMNAFEIKNSGHFGQTCAPCIQLKFVHSPSSNTRQSCIQTDQQLQLKSPNPENLSYR